MVTLEKSPANCWRFIKSIITNRVNGLSVIKYTLACALGRTIKCMFAYGNDDLREIISDMESIYTHNEGPLTR